jgi:hypothetical protein
MENLRTLNLSEKKDPVRDLWRNVLIVAIEDVIKKATVSARFSHYYQHTNKSALEYFEIPNRDFNLVCEYAQFDADMVRSKVLTKIKNIYLKEGKNGKNYLSEMPGERLYKNKTFSRSSNRYDRTMSAV